MNRHGILFRIVLSLHLLASLGYGAEFDPGRLTSGSPLFVYYNNGGSSYANKSFSAKSTDRSLDITGLTGTVLDGGDHWILDITGGSLNGRITSNSGVEIRLNGNTIVLSNTKTSEAIRGGGGVCITGPGVLHIDQWANANAVSSPQLVTIFGGAVVGINNLDGARAVSGKGIRVLGSAVHANVSEGTAFFTDADGFSINASIVTAISTKDCVQLRGHGPLNIFASSVHFISTSSDQSAIHSGTDIQAGGDAISVSSSVFCVAGGNHGIQFHENRASLAFDNVIGTIVGRKCGITNAKFLQISGGATKLVVVGNVRGEHSPSEIDPISFLEDDVSSGAAIWQPGAISRFDLDAGSVKLFAPGNIGLSVATNIVSGGSLRVESKAKYGDFQTLFTASGIISAAETVAGGLAFDSDILFVDIDLTQALSSVCTAADTIFGSSPAKATKGLWQRDMFVTGGKVFVSASGMGIVIGKNDVNYGYRDEAFYYQDAGVVEIESGGIGLADLGAIGGYTSRKEDESLIWIAGGRLQAKGSWDGILTCGGLLMEGGTLEAAATGGYAPETTSSKPGLRGFALSANNGLAIDGGSFLALAGSLRTTPNTSSEHNFQAIYPCILDVADANADTPVSIANMVPSWYGVNDLYPVNGKICFWLPVGSASLTWNGNDYVANANGVVAVGNNAFNVAGTSGRTVASIAIGGAGLVASGDSSTYLCTATYSDGYTATVTPSWTLSSGASYGSITAAGVFSANVTTTQHSVTIQASYGGKIATKTITITANSLPSGGNWYVDAAHGSDANDGKTWETAKATIQAAIDVSAAGDRIHVNDGTYGPIETNGKRLEIVSVNGAENTIVDAQSNGRCATLTDVTRPLLDFPMDTATVLRGFTLCNGNSREDGGAVIGGLLENCIIRDNRTDNSGGGAAAATLMRCIVRNNSAPNSDGGGAFMCNLSNCLVWNNEAVAGGGFWGGGHSVVNCTVAGNTATDRGGGMMMAFATNCIVWGNSAPVNPDLYSCYEWHLCSPVVDPDCGSVAEDPLFVNPAAGDFRLRFDSPCIDAGDNVRGGDDTDIMGNSRQIGAAVDIGCYEHTGTEHSVRPSYLAPESSYWGVEFGTPEEPLDHEDYFAPNDESGYSWRQEADGSWTGIVYGSGTPSALQDILASAEPGDTILVYPGCYDPISVDVDDVLIISTDGRMSTFLNGLYAAPCADLSGTTGTVLDGFTLVQGAGTNGGGIVGGVARDCLIAGCRATGHGGGAYNASLTDCVLDANSAAGSGGGAYGGSLNRCEVRGCVSGANGGGIASASATGCLLAGNRAPYGGGAHRATLMSCTVADNVAGTSGGGTWGCTARNSIVLDNTLASGTAANWAGTSTFQYTCTTPVPKGTGNFNAAPRFVGQANGNYHLSNYSKCRDKGNKSLTKAPYDLAGLDRVMGSNIDVGCYEYATQVTPLDPADYDGDGLPDIGFYNPNTFTWFLRQTADGTVWRASLGFAGVTVVPRDYDGDGVRDPAIYNPNSGYWQMLLSTTGEVAVKKLGWKGITLVDAADCDGDGCADPIIFNPASKTWQILRSADGGTTVVKEFGWAGIKLVCGDYDGDGIAELAFYSATSGTWYIRYWDGTQTSLKLGVSGARVSPLDADFDGALDPCYFDPATGKWTWRSLVTGEGETVKFGDSTVTPHPFDWDGDGMPDTFGFYSPYRAGFLDLFLEADGTRAAYMTNF